MSENMQPLTLELLAGGDLLAAINAALVKMGNDVILFPNTVGPRIVTIKISQTPVARDDENRPEIRWEVLVKTPGLKNAQAIFGRVSKDGKTILIDATRSSDLDQGDFGDNISEFPGVAR